MILKAEFPESSFLFYAGNDTLRSGALQNGGMLPRARDSPECGPPEQFLEKTHCDNIFLYIRQLISALSCLSINIEARTPSYKFRKSTISTALPQFPMRHALRELLSLKRTLPWKG